MVLHSPFLLPTGLEKGHPMAKTSILIVEDESIVALDLESRLLQLGYQVVGPVASGSAAIEYATSQQPDLILMDIRLQDTIDGITAAQVIQDRIAVPIVYLTAHSDKATLERAKQTQPHGYLVKPFNARELRTTIETALGKGEQGNESSHQCGE